MNKKFARKLAMWCIALAACVAVYWIFPEFFHRCFDLMAKGDIKALAEYMRSFGVWTAIILILLFVILTFDVVFPFVLLEGVAGIIYGFFWGTMLSWAGEVAGALAMFFVARFFFKDYVHGLLSKTKYVKQIDEYSSKKGFWILLYARLFPLAPSGIITAIAAISEIRFFDFILATVIGKLPPIVIKVLMGHDLAFIRDPNSSKSMLLLVIGICIAYGGFIWFQKHRSAKAKKNKDKLTGKHHD